MATPSMVSVRLFIFTIKAPYNRRGGQNFFVQALTGGPLLPQAGSYSKNSLPRPFMQFLYWQGCFLLGTSGNVTSSTGQNSAEGSRMDTSLTGKPTIQMLQGGKVVGGSLLVDSPWIGHLTAAPVTFGAASAVVETDLLLSSGLPRHYYGS